MSPFFFGLHVFNQYLLPTAPYSCRAHDVGGLIFIFIVINAMIKALSWALLQGTTVEKDANSAWHLNSALYSTNKDYTLSRDPLRYLNKNIVEHSVRLIISSPSPKQWLLNQISDLMTIISRRTDFATIFNLLKQNFSSLCYIGKY